MYDSGQVKKDLPGYVSRLTRLCVNLPVREQGVAAKSLRARESAAVHWQAVRSIDCGSIAHAELDGDRKDD